MKKMICKKCKTNNIVEAKYCINCGNRFSKKEINDARKGTFVGILETIDNFNNIKNLSFITQNKIFRVLSIIIVLLLGFINIYINGNNMKLTKNDKYEIKHYNDMYYVLTDDNKTNLDLYIPKKVEHLELILMDKDKLVSKKEVSLNDKLELSSNDESSYYLINGIGDNYNESLKVKIVYNNM